MKLTKIFNDPRNKYFLIVNDFLAVLTIASIVAIVLETVPSLSGNRIFVFVEWFAVFFFSLEYIGRFISTKPSFKYVFSFFGLVDLLAILPTYFGVSNFVFLKSARILRILRLLRILRITKIARHKGLRQKGEIDSFKDVSRMNILIYFVALMFGVVILSSLLYIFESSNPGFESIPKAMLWVLEVILGGAKLSSVVPETVAGTIIGIVTRFFSLVLLGVLISVIGVTLKEFLLGKDGK